MRSDKYRKRMKKPANVQMVKKIRKDYESERTNEMADEKVIE